MTRTPKIAFSLLMVAGLTACASNQGLEQRVAELEQRVSTLEQQQKANQSAAMKAMSEAEQAQQTAEDANTRADRMFENCCGKKSG